MEPLRLSLAKDDLVELVFSGDLKADVLVELTKETANISQKIAHIAGERGTKIKILIDISAFSGEYDTGAMEVVARFAHANHPYVAKTASFGGPMKARFAGDVVADLAERENIKEFDTRDEALAWLNEK